MTMPLLRKSQLQTPIPVLQRRKSSLKRSVGGQVRVQDNQCLQHQSLHSQVLILNLNMRLRLSHSQRRIEALVLKGPAGLQEVAVSWQGPRFGQLFARTPLVMRIVLVREFLTGLEMEANTMGRVSRVH